MSNSATIDTVFNDVKIFNFNVFKDMRGDFIKPYDQNVFKEIFNFNLAEAFFSKSNKGVIRGMHFQVPPSDHEKIVFCQQGKIYDVIVDLRKNSTTYNKFFSIELSSERGQALLIPKGFAHGYQSLEDNSWVGYLVSKCHAPEHDRGILWSSINAQWPLSYPIVSQRDQAFPHINNFATPF